MTNTTPATPPVPAPLPTTVWLDDQPRGAHPGHDWSPPRGSVLPPWAIERIRREFGAAGVPASLIHTTIDDTTPGMDARAHCTTTDYVPTGTGPEARTVLLAELHPDTLPAVDLDAPAAGDITDGWPAFLHRAHRLLRHRGDVLLLATRQRRDTGQLTDPLGTLIACARTSGYTYLQHIVIVHGHADGDRLIATPPDTTEPDLVHSDLLVFTSEPPAETTRGAMDDGEHRRACGTTEGTARP